MITTNIEKIEHDPQSKRVFSIFKTVFLVGGYIRDTLLSRPAVDRDYAVDGDPFRAAQKAEKIFPGKIIRFRDDLTVRISLKKGGTMDFTRLNGSILQDLAKRDFTINAMAYHPSAGLIDPWGGLTGLRNRCIRATRYENLKSDPLRTLRAFRFMSELGWDIEDGTMKGISDNCELISQSAPERITFEFIQLMNGKALTKALCKAQKAGLLKVILYNNNNKIRDNINNMVKLNAFIKALPYNKLLNEEVSQGLSKRSMLLLTALLSNINTSCTLLLINKKCIDFKNNTEKYCQYINKGEIDDKQLIELLRSMKDNHIEVGIYSKDRDLIKKTRKYIKLKEKPMLDGNEIADITGLSGPKLGKTLKLLETEIYIGNIRSKREAIAFLRSLERY